MKKESKKKRICIMVSAFFMLSMGVVHALSVKDSCTLYIGDSSAETASVGTSKKASFNIYTYTDSKAPTNAVVYACWSGWPYTLEQKNVVGIGQRWIGTEPQDKNSNFYIRLHGMYLNNTHATGKIEAK